MTDALSTLIHRPGREMHTADIGHEPKPNVTSREDLESEVLVSPGHVTNDYAEALAFAEEPVTIRIEPGGGKNPAPMIDCWVNGKGAEVQSPDGRWVVLGFLPVGRPITTRRKYVEAIAKAKVTTVNTEVGTTFDPDPKNEVTRQVSSVAPFSVIRDDSPKGQEWLTRIVRFD